MCGVAKQNEIYIIYVQNEKAQTIEANEWTRIETVNLDLCTLRCHESSWCRGEGRRQRQNLIFIGSHRNFDDVVHFAVCKYRLSCILLLLYLLSVENTLRQETAEIFMCSQCILFTYRIKKKCFGACCLACMRLSTQHILIDDGSFEFKWKLHFDSE